MTAPTSTSEEASLNQQISFYKLLAIFLVIAGFILGIWGAFAFCPLSTPGNLSGLGSYLQGAVGSVWSLAGLLFIYVAFLGQKQQIDIQKQEIKANRSDFEEQKKQIRIQNFESTFFQLLSLHHELVSQMTFHELDGRECFGGLHRRLNDNYLSRLTEFHFGNAKEKLIEIYLEVYTQNRGNLGHYFRNLYHIVKYVKTSDIPDKRKYTNIIRAQLSSYELILLFYNCLSKHGETKFKPLVVEFGLLKNIDADLLLRKDDDTGFYHPSAYQSENEII